MSYTDSSPWLKQAWTKSCEEVLAIAKVDRDTGLVPSRIREQRQRYGMNRLRKIRTRSSWKIFFDQLRSVVVILLVCAASVAAAFGLLLEAAAISAAVLVNTVIGFAMELHATRAMEALQRMGRVSARVLRDGETRNIDADKLVPGDILILEAGDMIAADIRILEANNLQCNEAALTGESVAVDKQTKALSGDDIALGELTNMAFKGTAVTQGTGSGLVVATGMETELGHISSMVEEAEMETTPLEKRLDALARRLVWLTLAIAIVVATIGTIAGKELFVMLETAIALAIAAVPEGLPIVATLALAQGMRRMARRNAIVKKLAAVETLGAANLIFTDKTGTLTENHMTLSRLLLDIGMIKIDYNNEVNFILDDQKIDPAKMPGLLAALEVGVLCSNADLEGEDSVGDPTEVALLEGAGAANIKRHSLLEEYPEEREISFDPDTKMMATFHKQDGNYRVAVKGAPEAVIKACTHVLTDSDLSSMDSDTREQWLTDSDKLADDGLRMLALAQKNVDDKNTAPYENLTLLGLAGLYDPPREGISETLAAFRRAGIRVVMGTGDHAITARAIAAQIGLTDKVNEPVGVAELKDIESISDAERNKLLEQPVFARISPRQKLDLISLYQGAGWVVGMTGDGVNDAPALKKSDIGIAMGQRGTEVAREAADMVLKDDAFATILVAIEHGRTIFQNIRRFIIYLLSGNLGEIMAISAAALVAAPLPMLPLQILYINFISDVMPALALGLSRSEYDVMQDKPRDVKEPILVRSHWYAIFGYGGLIAAAALGAFAIALTLPNIDTEEAVTIGFLTFGFTRLWDVFNMRSADSPVFINEITVTPFVWIAIIIGVMLLCAAVYIPVLATVLSVQAPDTTGWLLILSFSLLPLLVIQFMKITGTGWEKHTSDVSDT